MVYKQIDLQSKFPKTDAVLHIYLHEYSKDIAIRERPIVIVCPGGAYARTSDREAEIIAFQFLAMGYHAAVLRYSVAPAVYPAAILELGYAVSYMRTHGEEWLIDINKIILMGFSAGGHMVASYCMLWEEGFMCEEVGVSKEQLRPNAMILGYPVITSEEKYAHKDSFRNLLGENYEQLKDKLSLEKRVSKSVPRTFIWHTYGDKSVVVQNSIMLAAELVEKEIPTELHIFEKGNHGLALSNRLTESATGSKGEPSCECWIDLVHTWIENLNIY